MPGPVKQETKKQIAKTLERFTPKQVCDALLDERAKGKPMAAAKLLSCGYETVLAYIKKYPEVAEAKKEAEEKVYDLVEDKLLSLVDKGNVAAVIFYAKTKMKHRGYVERLEVEIIPVRLQQQLAVLCERHNVNMEDLLQALIDAFPSHVEQSKAVVIDSGGSK